MLWPEFGALAKRRRWCSEYRVAAQNRRRTIRCDQTPPEVERAGRHRCGPRDDAKKRCFASCPRFYHDPLMTNRGTSLYRLRTACNVEIVVGTTGRQMLIDLLGQEPIECYCGFPRAKVQTGSSQVWITVRSREFERMLPIPNYSSKAHVLTNCWNASRDCSACAIGEISENPIQWVRNRT